MTMSREKKVQISKWLVLLVVLVSCYVMAGFASGMDHMFWFLAIMNLVFGPACLIFYLIEVKKGVFAYTEEEEPDTID